LGDALTTIEDERRRKKLKRELTITVLDNH
jgi:hypothetical protein